MTNREYIINELAGLSDADLLDLWEYRHGTADNPYPIKSLCECCRDDNNDDYPCGEGHCVADCSVWMAAEVRSR